MVHLAPVAGQAFQHQLTADVSAGYRLSWSITPPSILPSGLTLDSAGMLSGTALVEPTGSTAIQVRGSILGVKTEWQPATIVWGAPPPPPPPPPSTSLALDSWTLTATWANQQLIWGSTFVVSGGALLASSVRNYDESSDHLVACQSAGGGMPFEYSGRGGGPFAEDLDGEAGTLRSYSVDGSLIYVGGEDRTAQYVGASCRLAELILRDQAGGVWRADAAALAALPSFTITAR